MVYVSGDSDLNSSHSEEWWIHQFHYIIFHGKLFSKVHSGVSEGSKSQYFKSQSHMNNYFLKKKGSMAFISLHSNCKTALYFRKAQASTVFRSLVFKWYYQISQSREKWKELRMPYFLQSTEHPSSSLKDNNMEYFGQKVVVDAAWYQGTATGEYWVIAQKVFVIINTLLS